MKQIEFNPSAEDIAAEVAHLQEKGIEGYGSKHLILYPRIDEEMEMKGGVTIKITQKDVETLTNELDVFFPVLITAPRATQESYRTPASPGDFVLPTARQGVVKTLHPTILAPVMEGAVYGLVEDYEVEFIKRK